MKKIFLGLFIFNLGATLVAQDLYSYRGFDQPISVVKYGGYYYLSNAGKNPDLSAKDGDGYISRMKSDGSQQEVTLKFIGKLNSPHGITAASGVLYVCDVDHLLCFDLQSKKKVFDLSFADEGSHRLNAVSEVVDEKLYVAATDINAIYEVSLADKRFHRIAEVNAPMCLLLANGKLYVSSRDSLDSNAPGGKLGYIDLSNNRYHELTSCEGFPWGIALDGDRLYYADWVSTTERQGLIRWYNLKSKATGRLRLPDRLGQPAELFYDARNNFFLVPAIMDGKVYGALGYK